MTAAAFRPGPAETDAPGWVVEPVWYSPAIGSLCPAHPGAGRSAPDCAMLISPPWHEPCQLCGFSRSRSTGLFTSVARIVSSVKFGA